VTETVIHMIGHAGTDVEHRQIGNGTDLSTFRLASTPRRFDRGSDQYIDGSTTWITVQCWRALALHVRDAVRRGDPLLVVGKLKTEEWIKNDERRSRLVLEAVAVGHDLARGVSTFRKTPRPPDASVAESAESAESAEAAEAAQAS
jgi:single-strand DNA-binding protein